MAKLEFQSPHAAGLKYLNGAFWVWFERHEHDTWPIKVWVISVRLKVADLQGLFERIFGPRPLEQA